MTIPGNFLSATTETVDPNTSGWTAKTNCTIGLGSGGRSGDGCLKLTSLASGEMQARTVSSYAVTAFTVYEAFCDASGVTVPERIGIRWLDSTNTEISITWGLTTATASATWHRIAVGGAAPNGAVRAQVVVSAVTPGAAGVLNYFENAFFGYPVTTTGNLFSFNAETSEIDASAWAVGSNCTIARQAPMVSWAVNAYTAGGNVIAMTAVASANASMLTVERPPATPGVEYVAFSFLNPPTSGANCWIELRFYNGAGSQIQVTRATLAQPSTNWYGQFVSAVAPAATATCAIAVGIDSATAGQVLRVDGSVAAVAPQMKTGSIMPYADSSFEQGAGAWTVASGVATLARSTPWGAFAAEGAYALTVTSSTATASVLRSGIYPLGAGGTAGANWRSEIWTDVTAGGFTIIRSLKWYNASNALIQTDSGTVSTLPTPGWWILTQDFTAPANATQAQLEYTFTATSTSSVVRVDRVSLIQALPIMDVTAHNTTASVSLTLRYLDTSQLLSVWRVAPDGSRTLVRGTSGLLNQAAITADVMLIEDYEAPLGVPVYYYVSMNNTDGTNVNTRTSSAVTLALVDRNYAWLKDPGQPQRNLLVMVAKAPDWQRPITQSVYRVQQRRNAVVLSDVRSGLEGELQIFTSTDSDRVALDWLMDSGDVLLWQANPGNGVSDMYVNVGQITETRVQGAIASEQWRTWALPLTETDMPASVGVSGSAGRTWRDVLTGFATWNDVLNAYATWEDVLFDNRIGG